MSKNNKRRKKKPFDIAMDVIIVLVLVVLVIVAASMIWEQYGSKKSTRKTTTSTTSTSTAEPTSTPTATLTPKEGFVIYQTTIVTAESNDTIFYLELDLKEKTYKEFVNTGSLETELDEGTYKEIKNGYRLTSTLKEDDTVADYIVDGDYLLSTDNMYVGEVPENEATFEAECVYNVSDLMETVINFKENGRFEQKITSFAEEGSSEEDQTVGSTGSYKRDGDFIKRTSDDGQILMDFYVYKNQISNAYYTVVK